MRACPGDVEAAIEWAQQSQAFNSVVFAAAGKGGGEATAAAIEGGGEKGGGAGGARVKESQAKQRVRAAMEAALSEVK